MIDIAQKYINEHGSIKTAVCRFVADLMADDPANHKRGYSRENAIIAAADAFVLDRRDIEETVANMTDNILKAEQAMGISANTRINLLDDPQVPDNKRQYQRHVAIEWEGGVLWLNMFDFAGPEYEGDRPHYCIDVRQFNSAGKVKGQGVFTMSRGYRGSVAALDGPEMVQGHGWNGGFLTAILTDPDGQETHTDDERTK